MTAWGYWPTYLGMDQVFSAYPWLDGGGNNVAIIDKGIDYWHPGLGGNKAQNIKSPYVVNVYDYRDNDTDPYPSESEATDPTTAHGTGVSGILAARPYDYGGSHYQGILQDSLLYNLRTNRFDSQNTIRSALQWVVNNHAQYNITAVNLTDFIGTGSSTALYAAEAQALWNAGVFVITPCANDWNNVDNPKQPIGLPAKDPYIFGTGGILENGTINPKTQRGPGLDILAPSHGLSLIYYTPSTNTSVFINGGEGNSWGTPHVLGTAVLIQQVDPTVTPAEIMQILKDSGVAVTDPDATGNYVRLDMKAAIDLAYYRRDDVYDQSGKGNNDLAHAAGITINNKSGSASNLKLLVGDPDYFTFTITQPDDYKLAIGYNASADWPDAQLLDAEGNAIAAIAKTGLTQRLAAGQYYLKIVGERSLESAYSVSINPVSQGGGTLPGQNGTFNDIAFDASNNLHFVWFDNGDSKLYYAKRTGNVWSNTQVVDSAAGTGEFLSMALDSTGKPGVAYYDGANGDLKFAKFDGSQWNTTTADSEYTTGYYPSLKFDASNRPVIAYYFKTRGDLRLAAMDSGGAWSITTIDSKGDVGRYPSLALNTGSGRWAIGYEQTSSGLFKYAAQGKTAWSLGGVAQTNGGGGFVSLAFDQNNLPAMSFYDAYNANLMYSRYTGSKWVSSTLASKGSQGLYTTLFFDPGTSYLPVVYYFNRTNNSVMAARSNGSTWEYENLASGGGRQLRVTLDSDAWETFSYYEDATGNLKITAQH